MLGDVLAGGIDREGQYQAGRFRSAQTEEALATARANQAKGLQTERENEARANIRALQETGKLDYSDPDSQMFTELLLGGMSADASQLGDYQNKAQQFRLRNTMSDPTQSALHRTRAGQALEGKPSSDLVVMGGNGVTNLTDDTPELSIMAGLGSSSDGTSTPMKIFRDRENLIAGGATPNQLQTFDNIVRNQVVQGGGGVPYRAPIDASKPVTAVVDPSTVAANTATTTDAKTTAGLQAKLRNALPGVMEGIEAFETSIDDFLKQPGFNAIYGKSGAAWRMAPTVMQSEDFRNADAKFKNLNAQGFMNAIQKMRGLGSLSNAEGLRVEAALTAALDPAQDEAQAAALWNDFKQRLATLKQVAEQEAGVAQQPLQFATEEEAAAAGLQPGTRVIIGGVPGTWE